MKRRANRELCAGLTFTADELVQLRVSLNDRFDVLISMQRDAEHAGGDDEAAWHFKGEARKVDKLAARVEQAQKRLARAEA